MQLTPGNAFATESEVISTNGRFCLNNDDQRSLAAFKLNCDIQEMDLIKCRNTLDACITAGDAPDYWWAEPKIVVAGMVVSAALGAVIVALVK